MLDQFCDRRGSAFHALKRLLQLQIRYSRAETYNWIKCSFFGGNISTFLGCDPGFPDTDKQTEEIKP